MKSGGRILWKRPYQGKLTREQLEASVERARARVEADLPGDRERALMNLRIMTARLEKFSGQ